jgi:hypothetical protein
MAAATCAAAVLFDVRRRCIIATSQRVRPEVAGPMTGSATKQSSSHAPAWIASLRSQ